jgi:hypothetical protein
VDGQEEKERRRDKELKDTEKYRSKATKDEEDK